MAQYACDQCPENCASADLPNVLFNDCPEAVISEESEITDLFLSTETVPSDWTNTSAWNAVLGQSAPNKIRRLTGIGDVPLPEAITRTISGGRIIKTSENYTINFDADDTTDANYAFMRRLQCGGTFKMWYQTLGKYLYGGPIGIEVNVSNAGEVLARGESGFNIFQFILTWTADCGPERIVSPIDAVVEPSFIFEDEFEEVFE